MGLVWDSALLQAPEPEPPSENALETPEQASKPVISGDLDLDIYGPHFLAGCCVAGLFRASPKEGHTSCLRR